MANVVVLGAGAWGTALALAALRANHQVTVLTKTKHHADNVNQTGENEFLKGVVIPPELEFSANPECLHHADILLSVLPTQVTRTVIQQLEVYIQPTTAVVICSKGFEHGQHNSPTGAMLSEVLREELPNQPIAVLSGPNFAIEVAKGLPAATTIASYDIELAKQLCSQLRQKYFRCYANDDVIGVQVCGSLKNVMAIACGVAHGKNLGQNAVAALITRGLAEVRRLALHLGAKEKTLLGLSAIGDMLLTCTSEKSRNMSLGIALGQGEVLDEYLVRQKSITEGYYTAQAVHKLNKQWQVNMPISNVVYSVLHEAMPVDEAVSHLMEQHSELEFEA